MNILIVYAAVALTVTLVGADDILKEEDIALVQDEKWFPHLYACLMDQEPCPEKMVIYRDTIPKYLETQCDSCSIKEKDLFEKIRKVVAEKYPKEFKALTDKLTPKAQ